jgi:hypothetical protein
VLLSRLYSAFSNRQEQLNVPSNPGGQAQLMECDGEDSAHGDVQVQLSVAFDLRPDGHATEAQLAQLGIGARLMAYSFSLSGKRTQLGASDHGKQARLGPWQTGAARPLANRRSSAPGEQA